jgi:hypothetical protein
MNSQKREKSLLLPKLGRQVLIAFFSLRREIPTDIFLLFLAQTFSSPFIPILTIPSLVAQHSSVPHSHIVYSHRKKVMR